jgi:hypothetical protein
MSPDGASKSSDQLLPPSALTAAWSTVWLPDASIEASDSL